MVASRRTLLTYAGQVDVLQCSDQCIHVFIRLKMHRCPCRAVYKDFARSVDLYGGSVNRLISGPVNNDVYAMFTLGHEKAWSAQTLLN